MSAKKDRCVAVASELLKQLAALEVELLDEAAPDMDQQEAARVQLVADILRREFGSQSASTR